jgi:hypothetical protein
MLAVKPAVFSTIAACELTPLPMPEVPTGAAALIEDAGAQWLVVAVCMPWRFDSPALPPRAARGAQTGPEQGHQVLVLGCCDHPTSRSGA